MLQCFPSMISCGMYCYYVLDDTSMLGNLGENYHLIYGYSYVCFPLVNYLFMLVNVNLLFQFEVINLSMFISSISTDVLSCLEATQT